MSSDSQPEDLRVGESSTPDTDNDADSVVTAVHDSAETINSQEPLQRPTTPFVEDSESFEPNLHPLRQNPADFYDWNGANWTRPAQTGNLPVQRPLPQPPVAPTGLSTAVNRAPPTSQNPIRRTPPGQLELSAIDFNQIIEAARLQQIPSQPTSSSQSLGQNPGKYDHLALSSGRSVTNRGQRASIGSEALPNQPPRPQFQAPERKGWVYNESAAIRRGKQRATDQSVTYPTKSLPAPQPQPEESDNEEVYEFLRPTGRGNSSSAGEPSGSSSHITPISVDSTLPPQHPQNLPIRPDIPGPTASISRTRARGNSIRSETAVDIPATPRIPSAEAFPTRRTRARSNSIRGDNPADVPITSSDQSLANLIKEINQNNEKSARESQDHQPQLRRSVTTPNLQTLQSFDHPRTSPGENTFTYRGVQSVRQAPRSQSQPKFPYKSVQGPPQPQPQQPLPDFLPLLSSPSSHSSSSSSSSSSTGDNKEEKAIKRRIKELEKKRKQEEPNLPDIEELRSSFRNASMDYQNYMQGGQQGQSPRQAPPSPSPSMSGGAMAMANGPGGLPGLPTPAGHQQDLSLILNLVEQLSAQLEENRATTRSIVAKTGRIRQRAIELGMSNDEIIGEVAEDMNDSSRNIELENAELRERLANAEGRLEQVDDNYQMFRDCIDNMLEQAHEYKYRNTMDTCAWHRSYRNQLADERQENMELRLRIADMGASAARGAEALRKYRRMAEGSDYIMYLQSKITEYRQERRYWKRRAFAYADPEDDTYSIFSSDSDINEEFGEDEHPPNKLGQGPPDQDSDGGVGGAQGEMVV